MKKKKVLKFRKKNVCSFLQEMVKKIKSSIGCKVVPVTGKSPSLIRQVTEFQKIFRNTLMGGSVPAKRTHLESKHGMLPTEILGSGFAPRFGTGKVSIVDHLDDHLGQRRADDDPTLKILLV